MPYAKLGKFDYGWVGGAQSPGVYYYGYPTAQASEPNVAAQWTFRESSGSLVDAVASITVPVSAGSPSYSQAGSGPYAQFLGVKCLDGQAFGNTSIGTNLNFGTSDFVIEWVGKWNGTGTGTARYMYSTYTSATDSGHEMFWDSTSTFIQVFVRANDGGSFTFQNNFSGVTELSDGGIHKVRVKGVRSGNCTLFVDGVSKGSASMATISGKNVASSKIFLMADSASGETLNGTSYELRFTIGNSTNNSSGPNGG